MKAFTSLTSLLSVAFALSSAVVASAQINTTLPGGEQISTYETLSAWEGSRSSLLTSGAIAQTFQLPSQFPALYSMTWRFTSANNPVSGNSVFDAYLTQWNASTNKPTGSALWSHTTVNIPAFGAGNHDYFATPNLMLNPANTYALIIRGVNVASNVRAPLIDEENLFPLGASFRAATGASSFSSLATAPFQAVGFDWAFAQLTISDSILTPVPEAGTVAVFFAGALVVGLGFRRRGPAKREAAALPAVAA